MCTKEEIINKIKQIKFAIANACILGEDVFFVRCLEKTLIGLENKLETL